MRISPASSQNENADPFVISPPRKYSPNKNDVTTTPATPKSRSTPLHKRFLEEVRMAPGTPTTPPRTPSRSPKQGPLGKQTLEVGQNGFYFSMEISEKKITPRRAATPDAVGSGRRTPSPEKEQRSRTNVGGSVKDILRKNLFGTPTKKAATPRMGVQKEADTGKSGEATGSPSKGDAVRPASVLKVHSHNGSGSESSACANAGLEVSTEGAQSGIAQEAPTENLFAPTVQSSRTASSQATLQLTMPARTKSSAVSAHANHTPQTQSSTSATNVITPAAPTLDLRKTPTTSTPSNIGHLMAGLSNKSSKVQTPPPAGGAESMPTPLRKMSERLALSSPHVVRRGRAGEAALGDPALVLKHGELKLQISALDLRDAATVEDRPASCSRSIEIEAPRALIAPKEAGVVDKENHLAQLRGSPIMATSPLENSRPSTATTASCALPSTPLRPDAPSRSKSFGTPTKLRSSIQEDMIKLQESLKRSLGPEFVHQTSGTRSATPVSVAETKPGTPVTKQSRVNGERATRPVSMVGPAKTNGMNVAQAVARKPLNTAARKPRPKSMIVGSAKILETVASQNDLPRERAKLRSSAAAPSGNRTGPSTSRPGTAAPILRKPVPAPTTLPTSKPQPVVRTTKAAALRAAAHSKRAVLPTPIANPPTSRQRVVSAEAIAERVAEWKNEDRQNTAPKVPVRTKSTKAPSKPAPKQTNKRTVKTPVPKDPKVDSGTGQSFTPPGTPTRLPSPTKPPSKTRLTIPTTPAARKAPPPSNAAKLRSPLPAKTPASRRIDPRDPNAARTPSKEIVSSLDRAIDAKIAEDRRRAREFAMRGV